MIGAALVAAELWTKCSGGSVRARRRAGEPHDDDPFSLRIALHPGGDCKLAPGGRHS